MSKIYNFIKLIIRKLYTKYCDTLLSYDFYRQIRRLDSLQDPIFIIGIKGSLHLIDLCLQTISKSAKVILIFAGMDEWEVDWAKKHFSVQGFVVLEKQLKHGAILDLLFKCRKKNFGIMDYDLFITNSLLVDKMISLSANSIGNVLFMYEDPNLNLRIPQTFFMFFNALMIRNIIQKYSVSCSVTRYKQLSPRVRSKLQQLKINGDHNPESIFGKDYFDTFRIIALFSLAEGHEFNWVDGYNGNALSDGGVFHVGGVSNPADIKNRWRKRGSYFWQRCLALHPDQSLRDYYKEAFPNLPSIESLEESLHADGYTGSWYFESVDALMQLFIS